MASTDTRTRRRWWPVAAAAFFGVPAGLGLLSFAFGGAEPAALLAPGCGPFAGMLYGHSDCTMWNQLRGWSLATIGLGVAASVLAIVGSRRRWPLAALLPGLAWSLAWTLLAVRSMINASM